MRSGATAARFYSFVQLPEAESSGSKKAESAGRKMKENVCGNRGEKSAMSIVYIFAASAMEVEPVRKIATATDSHAPARCGANDVVFIVSGMGPANAKNKANATLVTKAEGLVTEMP